MEHEKYLKTKPLITAKEYFFIILGLFPFALMVNWVFVPHNVVGGGLTGICSIIYYATGIEIWISSLVINSILLIIAIATVGWQFCVRTVVAVLTLSFWYKVIPLRTESLIEDPILACIVGGVVFGLALGVVMLNNGSSGGTDIIAMVVNKYRDISLGRVMIYCDFIIIASSYLLPVPEAFMDTVTDVTDFKLKRIMCGLCMTVSYTAALDWFISRMRQSVQFMIFSLHYKEIATAINDTVHRGVTVLDGTGWYSQQPIKVVTVLARKHESQLIYKLIKAIDPNAFVSQSYVSGVFGQGFDKIKTK